MRNLILLWLIFSALLTNSLSGARRAEIPPVASQAPAIEDDAFVQVSSVTVDPPTIHTGGKPNSATVTVQFILSGKIPPGSTARVSVGTYMTDPPRNNLTYDPAQVVQLKESPMVVKFGAQVSPSTIAGKLVVAASINRPTNGVQVKLPENPEDWRAKLLIADP